MQCGFRDVDAVEITYEALDARVRGIIQQVPVELPIVIPFALLRDFAAP